MRKHLVMAALLGLSAAPVVAQQKGTIEIGAFDKYTHYDKSFGTLRSRDNFEGVGGRLGYFFNPRWELELNGSINENDTDTFFRGFTGVDIYYYPFRLRMNFNQKLGDNSPVSWLIGAGPAYNKYGQGAPAPAPTFKGSDWGISGMTGLRANLTRWFALRVDGTIDYIPSPNNGKTAVTSQGITATTAPSHNTNLGAEFGVSVLLGMCDKGKDGTTISPTSASIRTGGTASFSGTATSCGKADVVVYTVSGPGAVSASGMYTAAGAGTATVTACGRSNKMCSTATVTVTAPPPPPPPAPPRTLSRCELTPANSSPRIDQAVSYSVTGYYSDGTSAPLSGATISAPGGSMTGNSVSWSTAGAKTVTANCGNGISATATADVQRFAIVVRDSAFFNVDKTVIYRTEDQTRLNAIAAVLKEHPDIRLVIDGHTDSDASVKYNEKLGMARATAMKAYFAKQGVPVDRMTIILRSFSECKPVASNATKEGRTQNRRAELNEFGNTQPGPADASCKEAGRERNP